MSTEMTRFCLDMDGSMEPDGNGRWVRYDDVANIATESAVHADACAKACNEVARLHAVNAELINSIGSALMSCGYPVIAVDDAYAPAWVRNLRAAIASARAARSTTTRETS